MTKKITELFAIVMEDKDRIEGILSERIAGQWYPFIGSDTSNMDRMLQMADKIALKLEQPYKILKFKLIETITNGPAQNIRSNDFGTC